MNKRQKLGFHSLFENFHEFIWIELGCTFPGAGAHFVKETKKTCYKPDAFGLEMGIIGDVFLSNELQLIVALALAGISKRN